MGPHGPCVAALALATVASGGTQHRDRPLLAPGAPKPAPPPAQGLRVQWHSNAVLAAPPAQGCPGTAPSATLTVSEGNPLCASVTSELFSARFDATVTAPSVGAWEFAVRTNGAARLWMDDHVVVDTSCFPCLFRRGDDGVCCAEWAVPTPLTARLFRARSNVTRGVDAGLHMRLEWLHYGGGNATLEVLWRRATPTKRTAALTNGADAEAGDDGFEPVPASALTPTLSRAEEWRQEMQGRHGRGWNTWSRDSAARHVHLPTAVGVEVQVFDEATGEVFAGGLVDKCQGADARTCKVIVGLHTANGSFSEWTQRTSWSQAGDPVVNFTVSSGHLAGTGGDGVAVVVTPSRRGTTLWVNFTVGFFFDCAVQSNDSKPSPGHFLAACGSVAKGDPAGTAFDARPTGFARHVRFSVPGATAPPGGLGSAGLRSATVPLAGGPAVLIASYGTAGSPLPSSSAAAASVEARRREAMADLDSRYPRSEVGGMRDGAEAIRTVVGWNTVWDQRVKVATPVSRTFGMNPWTMWDWDSYAVAMLASESSAELAFANAIVTTRGRGVRGNVPNARCPQWQNDDRSEPYVGAKVVLELFRRHGEPRLLELLYDDLVAWQEWVLARRVLQPGGLVSVGSDVVGTPPHDGHTKQAAIWETGMDNSPMYDEVTWDSNASKMLIYDVGMTSEFVSETDALADIADALNRTADAKALRARRDAFAERLQSTLWNDGAGLYFNFQADTRTFNSHSSPTSFYPMLSGTATVAQATRMVREWLLNDTRFCVGAGQGPPPPPPLPPPPPPPPGSPRLRLWWGAGNEDNAICVQSAGYRCAAALDTSRGDAKRASAAAVDPTECCPTGVRVPGYRYMRDEGFAFASPSPSELARHSGVPTVGLRMFYSAANRDNFLGVNATWLPGYAAVRAGEAGHELPNVVATAFASQPNGSYVPLDVYWSESRRDFQTVGSPESRRWLSGYAFVQRLGWVLPVSPSAPRGKCSYAVPSTPYDDPAFWDNTYWRGRTWGPLNWIVYMGLRHPRYAHLADVARARRLLATRSREALMVEWLPKHHVHENLNPVTGLGDDVPNSNPMYHWGALLALLEIWESGRF